MDTTSKIVKQQEFEEMILETSLNMDDILSTETMDMPSPEMWPEKVSGVKDFINSYASEIAGKSQTYSTKFTKEEREYLYALARLDVNNLTKKIKELHDCAYQLGLEEINEVARGKNLNLFVKKQ